LKLIYIDKWNVRIDKKITRIGNRLGAVEGVGTGEKSVAYTSVKLRGLPRIYGTRPRHRVAGYARRARARDLSALGRVSVR